MKKIIIPNNISQIMDNIQLVDGFIIGIKDMSVNTGYNIEITDLPNILDIIQEKEIFISLNKNMENEDLFNLKTILVKLNKYNISGILYTDVCFINLKKELNLKYDLIWAQEHLTTNYETINYWNNFGVNYTYLSSDITLDDTLNIRKNTSVKLMVNIFGYLPMFVSKRHIVKNYLNYFKLKNNSSVYYMAKENEIYPIIDNNIGTQVYSSKILNCMEEYYLFKDNDIDYIVLNGFQIDNSIFNNVIELFNNISKDNLENSVDKINKLLSNNFKAFLYQDTVSKVKKNVQ